jgi:hypothetical protein
VNLPEKIFHIALKHLNPFRQLKLLLAGLFANRLVKIFFLLFLLSILAPILFFIIYRPVPQTSINYGVNFSNKYAIEMGQDWKQTYLTILDELHVKHIRVMAYWDDIERVRGVYDFNDIIWQLEEADKRDVNVILAIGRKVPRFPECFEPVWWRDMPNEDERNEALYQYITVAQQTLGKYKSVKIWQVENEPFFPFGSCLPIKKAVVSREVEIVRLNDGAKRPILIQDSGEGGFWFPSYSLGDYLGISMYRKIWYNFWGVFFGRFIYFQYPLAHWTYKIKAAAVGVPYQNIIVTELQAEPWGPGPNHLLPNDERDKTMSRTDFLSTISYAQKAGFKDLYFWGAEWWLFEKNVKNNPFYWDTAKALFN